MNATFNTLYIVSSAVILTSKIAVVISFDVCSAFTLELVDKYHIYFD